MNKKAIMLHFIVTVILALIIFIPACAFAAKFFRVSEQAQENFADFVKTLEEFSANTKEKDSFLLIMDQETFIAAFRYPTIVEFHVESPESGGGTFSQERTTVVSKYFSYPPQCTITPCICLCREFTEEEVESGNTKTITYHCTSINCRKLDAALQDNWALERGEDDPRRISISMNKENSQIVLTTEKNTVTVAADTEAIDEGQEDYEDGEESGERDDNIELLSTDQASRHQRETECFIDNFGMYDDKSVKLERVKVGGKWFEVNTVMAEPLRRVALVFEKMNYKLPDKKWGNSCRKGMPRCGAFHPSCLAIDINPGKNPSCPSYAEKDTWHGRTPTEEEREKCRQREVVTDLPREIIQAFEDNGFYWGGRFGSSSGNPKPDAMHFEYIGPYNFVCCKRDFNRPWPDFTSFFIPPSTVPEEESVVEKTPTPTTPAKATTTPQIITTDKTLSDYLYTPVFVAISVEGVVGNREITMMDLILLVVENRYDSVWKEYYLDLFQESTKAYFKQNVINGQVWVYNSVRYNTDQAQLFASGEIYSISREIKVELPTRDSEIPKITVVMYIS